MAQTTLDADRRQRLAISGRERLGAWLYTGAPGRLASFSIDLALSLALLGLWSTRRLWRRVRRADGQSPAA